MFAKIRCAGLFGVQGFLAETEADSGTGLPGVYLTGALSPETKEAQYRVFTAIRNSGLSLKPRKVTINISPAGRKKEGTGFDLPILTAVLAASGILEEKGISERGRTLLASFAFLGELGLDGSLKPVRGVLPMTDALRRGGMKGVVVPYGNAREAALVPDILVVGVRNIQELMELFTREGSLAMRVPEAGQKSEEDREGEKLPDFSDIRGQAYLKRAAEVAVSGRHNLLLSGAAGSGKTMIARRIPGIMPELTREEQIQLTKLYSICGLLPEDQPLLKRRPFRAPHHASSLPALLGGGNPVRPGEVSLSAKGVLFLDELPLFRREVIEALREPLEERRVLLTRLRGVYEFPADFSLVAACNNCPCGFYPDRKRCRCTPAQIRMYQGRLSKPILERIDICAEARPVEYGALSGERAGESSQVIRGRVEQVYEIQKHRFRDCGRTRYNSEMTPEETERFCRLTGETEELMRRIYEKKGLSLRTYHKVLRVARTLADMAGREEIGQEQLLEAVSLRSFEDRLWGGERYAE